MKGGWERCAIRNALEAQLAGYVRERVLGSERASALGSHLYEKHSRAENVRSRAT